MSTCSPDPRTISDGLDWFLSHDPSDRGLCAQHSWHSLGGDRGCPPAWSCPNANAVYDKVIDSGVYWTDPHQGDIAIWKYGENGHEARVYDEAGTLIATTDPSNGEMVGIEPIGYPAKWGASSSKRIFTNQYNGIVCFQAAGGIDHGDVYLSKLVYGQKDSDSVARLQMHLNAHSLKPPGDVTLPVTGNYLDETDTVVIADQQQHGFGNDPKGASSVGPKQAAHLLSGCGCVVIDDMESTGPPPTPDVDPPTVESGIGFWDWYSGKLTDKVLVQPDGEWHDIKGLAQPESWIEGKSKEEHFIYLRVHLPKGRTATRTIHYRFLRSDGDETAMDSRSYDSSPGNDSIAFPSYHTESGSGLGGKWQIAVEGGTDPIDYTTRYAKTYVTFRG